MDRYAPLPTVEQLAGLEKDSEKGFDFTVESSAVSVGLWMCSSSGLIPATEPLKRYWVPNPARSVRRKRVPCPRPGR